MFLDFFHHRGHRREEIRRHRPDRSGQAWQRFKTDGGLASVGIAALFWVIASSIAMMRENVIPYRPGQFVRHDIVSRVDFVFHDEERLTDARNRAGIRQPRVYRVVTPDPWTQLQEKLLALPEEAAGANVENLPTSLRDIGMDSGALQRLQQYNAPQYRKGYEDKVRAYVQSLRDMNLVIIPAEDREKDLKRQIELRPPDAEKGRLIEARTALALPLAEESEIAKKILLRVEQNFLAELQSKIYRLTVASLGNTAEVDAAATADAKNDAIRAVPKSEGDRKQPANTVLVSASASKRTLDTRDWKLLLAENEAFLRSIDDAAWKPRIGLAGMTLLLTLCLCAYVARHQPRVVRNHMRAIGIAALMLSMLLVAELAGIGSNSLYFFGVAPTILVAFILAIGYDQRFAMGVSTMHALLVTAALGQGIPYFLILWVGVLTVCFLLDDVRTRSKLIEIGGAAAITMGLATMAAGAIALDPLEFIGKNVAYSAAAGFTVGFLVLGILPFVEKAFRITTSMTLLELADVSQPLLRRLALEAPGTYNHSLQVATLAEAAAESIGAHSLMCRVASYYHDVGKINKAEYFVENQTDGNNRHLNLSPSVSLLIILGHVKDGIEMAREYNLPTSIFPFIQQHHGTMLVEYFYHQACNQKDDHADPDQPAISEVQYRYPGPKPRTREVAVVMLSDAVESACRAMPEPTASRVEALVHDLAMKRFLDGQFDECDLTMRDLELIERSLVKSLLGIYHGRIAYPTAPQATQPPIPVARTA